MSLRCLPLALLLLAAPAAASAAPITNVTGTTLPKYQGAPATAQPIKATKAPQNPYMAPNPRGNIHNDTWMTDAYAWAGPLGRNPIASSGSMDPALCGSLTFDSHGHIVSVCPSIITGPQARVIDAKTLEVLSTYTMPTTTDPPGQKAYQNFSGGGYFFLDGSDRIWSATKTSHLLVLQVAPDGKAITPVQDYDLTSVLDSDQRITSALPDFQGRIWFVSKKGGTIGILDPKSRKLTSIKLGEEIENSFTIDRDAVYIVSDKRMYRFGVGKDGKPKVQWKVTYANSGIVKPSQVDAGSGTTPTITNGGFVAITDNADPMNVVVYRTARKLRKGQKRTVCAIPVFDKGASATENSLIAAGRAFFVENNYGYQDPFGPMSGAVTTPGLARVDIDKSGKRCHKVWTNTTERVPTAVSKVSTRTGLLYTYTRDEAPLGEQPYFWTAISARTGKTAFKVYAGSGLGFNNNYAGLALGPDGTAYLGVTGGIVTLRDGG
ncbi:MAG: hypothetical protein JWM73_2548 [Solirubrobacterales bacterium]|nr:hypothetical protein [Solirubrobacterales bacterium]